MLKGGAARSGVMDGVRAPHQPLEPERRCLLKSIRSTFCETGGLGRGRLSQYIEAYMWSRVLEASSRDVSVLEQSTNWGWRRGSSVVMVGIGEVLGSIFSTENTTSKLKCKGARRGDA